MLQQKSFVDLKSVIQEASMIAKQYRELTGKPLGITGEVGEVVAADILGLQLTEARKPGYDATDGSGCKIQIKTRCVHTGSSPGQRVGSIKLNHEWDSVTLVLLDAEFEPLAIYEADRSDIERELERPGSKARNVRGALSVSKFKAISKLAWSNHSGVEGSLK